MERAGLIERRPNPTDRRSQLVYLTAAGKARLAAASPAVQAVERELEADFTAADRAAAARLARADGQRRDPDRRTLTAFQRG